MNRETYLGELTAHLQCRGVSEKRIAEIIAEVENHLHESGEQSKEAFGPAAAYAEKMAAFTENNPPEDEDTQWHNRTFKATAFDEMETLGWAGKEGWELVDVGPLALFCKRPVVLNQGFHWEYVRRTGTHRRSIVEEMITSKWEPCGQWIVFHYFKRKVGPLNTVNHQKEA